MTMASVAATMVTGTGRILETGPVPTTAHQWQWCAWCAVQTVVWSPHPPLHPHRDRGGNLYNFMENTICSDLS